MDELANDEATNNEMAPENPGEAGLEADGYYGEDEMDAEELDLSFLDEEDDAEADDAKTNASR
jgi:hypothetical protein